MYEVGLSITAAKRKAYNRFIVAIIYLVCQNLKVKER